MFEADNRALFGLSFKLFVKTKHLQFVVEQINTLRFDSIDFQILHIMLNLRNCYLLHRSNYRLCCESSSQLKFLVLAPIASLQHGGCGISCVFCTVCTSHLKLCVNFIWASTNSTSGMALSVVSQFTRDSICYSAPTLHVQRK